MHSIFRAQVSVFLRSDGEPVKVALLEALRDRVGRHESTENSHDSNSTCIGSSEDNSCSDADTRVALATESLHRTSSS